MTKCSQTNCSEDALWAYQWPGQEATQYACLPHANKAQAVANSLMASHLKMTPVAVEVPTPTPGELARCFWAMDADEQAQFFHEMGVCAEHTLCPQLAAVHRSHNCTITARHVMATIGEYGA